MTTNARNAKFEEHSILIDQAIQEHHGVIQSVRLSEEDARQDLSIEMLEALDAYTPETGLSLETYISRKLSFTIMNMIAPSKLYGVPWAPRQQPFQVMSLDVTNGDGEPMDAPLWNERPACIWMQDEIASLPDAQRAVINKLLCGEKVHCKNKSLLKARRYLRKRMDEVGVTRAQEWKECISFG